MKNKLTKLFILLIVAIMTFGSVTVSAFESYDTYTYSIDGEPLHSPTAYSAEDSYDSRDMGLSVKLSQSEDVFADYLGNIYIADKGNNRIVILDADQYVVKGTISEYIDENNVKKSLKSPTGVYVTDPTKMKDGSTQAYIYVCDWGNSQLVVFDESLNYVKTISKPESSLVTTEIFVPYAVAVDIYGRIFVVSKSCSNGVIVLSNDGDFTGFIGAQKISSGVLDSIWKNFQTDAQKEQTSVATTQPFNNITVDDDGFVYVTLNYSSEKIDEKSKQMAALKSKAATYSPVKKLNSTGKEIMKRNGFFDPSGEVGVFYAKEVSNIIDVAIGAEGAWSILDSNPADSTARCRIFTYNNNGDLLYAFGDKGDQLGSAEGYVAMAYQVVDGQYKLVLLDNAAQNYKITVYSPTEYCDTITKALKNQNDHNYAESIECWQELLTKNNNFDLAYIGIGKALYNQGDYEGAMEILSFAYETEYYSLAFAEVRKEIISKWLIPLLIVAIVLIVLLLKFLGFAKKKNKEVSLIVGKKKYWQELIYVFHLVFHPFDGFWDLKHEKRGSVRAATTILGITVLAFFYQAIGQGYIFQPRENYDTIILQVVAVLVPVLLWVISNWCLTTLFDGEGNLKDVYISTCYSLAPLPLFVIVSTILTNVLTVTESQMVTLLVSVGYVWVAFLLFFGTLVTHGYSIGKNVITILGTILAMVVIMFVAILFSSLVIKMVTFIISLVTEVWNRI